MTLRSRLGALISLSCTLLSSLACGPEPGSTTDASASETTDSAGTTAASTDATTGTTAEPTTGATTDGSSSGTTRMPDPDHVRECQPGDFICKDLGCDGPALEFGECYKPCTPDPDAIGEPDPECDEPERPFCSQIGLFEGGDFGCNGCVHICVAEPINFCDQPADGC